MKYRILTLLFLVTVLLTACAGPISPVVATQPTQTSPAAPVPNSQNGEQPLAVSNVIEALAVRLNVAAAAIKVTSVEAVEWPNGCLGLDTPGEMCTQAIVPGYRVVLEANGETYTFRTDRTGGQVREETGLGVIETGAVVLTWNRAGGIAGFCDQLVVHVGGQALISSCKDSGTGSRVRLTPAQEAQLADWQQRFGSFTYEQKDPAVADAMTVSLVFNGSGQEVPGDSDKADMLTFAQEIFTGNTQ